MGARDKISVIVPCKDEEEVIERTYSRLTAVLSRMDVERELVFVDDGSADGTWRVLRSIRENDPSHVKLVRFSRNFGHQYALTAGMKHATGDYALVIDADLQDPPEILPKMYSLIKEGHDSVYGVRRSREGETAFKKFSAYLFYRLINLLSNVDLPPDSGDFRLMSRKVLDSLAGLPEAHRYLRGMTAWVGFDQCPIEYDREARKAGATKFTFWKMLRFSLDAIFSFSAIPLRLATYLGALLAFGAVCYFGVVLHGWFRGTTVPGWSSLIAAVIFIGGVQLVILGIAGEYIGRIYEEVKRRPMFIEAEVLGPGEDEPPLVR